jgi:hypothetical protein
MNKKTPPRARVRERETATTKKDDVQNDAHLDDEERSPVLVERERHA